MINAIDKSAHTCKPNAEPCEDYGCYRWSCILDVSAIDAPSLTTEYDAYDILWLHQGLQQQLLRCEEEHGLWLYS